MAKQKFKYNPETLSYEVVKVGFGKRMLQIFLFLAPTALFGLLFTWIYTKNIDSPKETSLRQELMTNAIELERIQREFETVNEALDVLENRDEVLYRGALYADSFPEELRRMGTGGSDKYAYLSGITNEELLKSTSKELDALERRVHAQSLSFRELSELLKDKEKMMSHIPAIQPVANEKLKKMVSGYGWRIDPHYKTRKMHTGMDFTAATGTDVYATGDGKVVETQMNKWGYGLCVVIDHGYGYKTRYAHLSKILVKEGQKVKRGELIGLVGSTGKSTGPHLHYEVEKNGEKVNPIAYYHNDLTPEQYEELLRNAELSNKSLD